MTPNDVRLKFNSKLSTLRMFHKHFKEGMTRRQICMKMGVSQGNNIDYMFKFFSSVKICVLTSDRPVKVYFGENYYKFADFMNIFTPVE